MLVISGLSIVAVDDGKPKPIADTGVFAITSICSLWAYIWLYLTLKDFSENIIEPWEAWLTLVFFVILIVLSFGADKINTILTEKKKTAQQKQEEYKQNEINKFKTQLRTIARDKGEEAILMVAQGKKVPEVSETKAREIISLYKSVFETDNLSSYQIEELYSVLKPDSLLERFAYRKQTGTQNRRDFIKLKGAKGQIAHEEVKVENENDTVGFKCLHYSVTESNGHVEVSIVKKVATDLIIGVRTVPGTAVAPKDFTHIDDLITIKKRDTEFKLKIPIVDDEEWEPDLDFFIELYDT